MSDLTLGIEEELHLVDLATGRLAARAPELLAQLPSDSFTAELQLTTVEINTSVATTLDGLRNELLRRRRQLVQIAGEARIGVAAVGIAPIYDPMRLTENVRFEQMREDYQLLVDEQLICGTQVHVGVGDRDAAVAVAARLTPWLPTLLALSASSPFWHGEDSGYASMRTLIWQRWPTAGPFGQLSTSAQYDQLLRDLVGSGAISDAKMAYFDVRPSNHLPTLELRVCDACPLVDDAVMIAGLFRGLVATELRAVERGEDLTYPAGPMYRAATWRAARSGLEGELVDLGADGLPAVAEVVVRRLLEHVRPALRELGDWERVRSLVVSALARGTSAARQRAEFSRRHRLSDVVDLVVAETQGLALSSAGHVPGQRRSLLAAYPSPPGDEVLGQDGLARFEYQGLLQVIEDGGGALLRERALARDRHQEELGLVFRVENTPEPGAQLHSAGSRDQLFPVDLIPRIVSGEDWKMLRTGLAQRARALELFLRDAYGAQNAVRDGIIPLEVLTSAPGWQEVGRRVPAGAVRAHVLGVDLVRDERGRWIVLEDNLRIPSGVGYALSIRRLMDEVMPDLPRPHGLLDASGAPLLLRRALRAAAAPGAGDNPVLVLLSDGPGNSAWFEHQLLARTAGLELVTAADLLVQGDRVVMIRDDASVPVDVMYVRVDAHELGGLIGADGKPLGDGFWDVVEAGQVAVANGPGNGVADDKAVYAYVPALIEYYLGELPLLQTARTYPCSDPEQREMVLERLDDLVIKPVDGYGGGGVLIGPHASQDELALRRKEIQEHPEGWIGQEIVSLSSHPTFDGRRLQPRHIDLRAFVYLTGAGPEDAHVADLGLTRVAPPGSLVVNSSRGGGAKDTWLLSSS
jgi:carboxylate-amine ligase